MNTENMYLPRKEINIHNWWKFENEFSPPLIGPYDFRIFKGSKLLDVHDYNKLVGIPKLLKMEKAYRQEDQYLDSCFTVERENLLRQPVLYHNHQNDKQVLKFLQKEIQKIIH